MSDPIRPHVVVGIAEAQPATLRFALDEARCFKLDLQVVHCAGYVNHSTRTVDQIYYEDWREAAERVLAGARASIGHELDPPKPTYRVSDHGPVDELLQTSTRAAEIVVGSDNPSWFARMLGPGVSQIVARAAVCPVVVFPEHQPESPRAHGVVVGIEGAQPEEHVLRYAFEHADRRSRELSVIHALPPNAWVGEVEAHHAAVGQALDDWSEKFPNVSVRRTFVEGEPSRVLARASRNAQLVVVGQPRPSLVPYAIDRPMSYGLLKHAHSPVAIIPDVVA